MNNLTKSVDTKIENLVTLNGVKNSSPNFWAPTDVPTALSIGKIPVLDWNK
jgi:hypothetical protein